MVLQEHTVGVIQRTLSFYRYSGNVGEKSGNTVLYMKNTVSAVIMQDNTVVIQRLQQHYRIRQ